jgi:hypothetical protein
VDNVQIEDDLAVATDQTASARGVSPKAVILVAAQRDIAPAQTPSHIADADPSPEFIAPENETAVNETESQHPPLPCATPIDLTTALQLTAGQNPQVAFAQQRIEEAFAQLQAAQVLWVPSLRAGVNYNKH